jgi:hypothetical protein
LHQQLFYKKKALIFNWNYSWEKYVFILSLPPLISRMHQTIVDTMSSINNNTGMDVMQKYTAMMADTQYQNIPAASWK